MRSLRTPLARPLHAARADRTRRDGRATGSGRRVTAPSAASRATQPQIELGVALDAVPVTIDGICRSALSARSSLAPIESRQSRRRMVGGTEWARQKTAVRRLARATFCPFGSPAPVAGRTTTRAPVRARSAGVLAAVRCLRVIPWIRKGRRRAPEPPGPCGICWSHRQQWQKTRPVLPRSEALLSARCTTGRWVAG